MSVYKNTQRCSTSQQWGIWKSRSNQSKRSDRGIHPSALLSGGLWETPSAWQLSSTGEELIAEGLEQLHYPSTLRPKHSAILLLDHFCVTFRHNTLELEVWLFAPTNDWRTVGSLRDPETQPCAIVKHTHTPLPSLVCHLLYTFSTLFFT